MQEDLVRELVDLCPMTDEEAQTILESVAPLAESEMSSLAEFQPEELIIRRGDLGQLKVVSQKFRNVRFNLKHLFTKTVPLLVALNAQPLLALSAYDAVVATFEVPLKNDHARVAVALWEHFPKDVASLQRLSEKLDPPMERATLVAVLEELERFRVVRWLADDELIHKVETVVIRD